MSVTLDGQTIFEEQGLTISAGSPKRASIERTVAGLDGMLSIDMGARSRQIRQTGTLHAMSRSAMRIRVEAITRFIDGQTHTLVAPDGEVFRHLRMDSFQKVVEHPVGAGVVIDYEIAYTQLGGQDDAASS
jgi:hypothetical protein